MTVYIDHAFITCDVDAPEGNSLLRAGFVEGTSNVHAGQGTSNRRFFFDNFMVELLWVANSSEAMSDDVLPTGLWERWSLRGEGISRFGMIFGGTATENPEPLFVTRSYQPKYFPPSKSIEIVQGLSLDEPAMFWIPWLTRDSKRAEATGHTTPVRSVARVSIGIPNVSGLSSTALRVREAGLVDFFEAPSSVIELHFQAHGPCSIECRPDLPLIFTGSASL